MFRSLKRVVPLILMAGPAVADPCQVILDASQAEAAFLEVSPSIDAIERVQTTTARLTADLPDDPHLARSLSAYLTSLTDIYNENGTDLNAIWRAHRHPDHRAAVRYMSAVRHVICEEGAGVADDATGGEAAAQPSEISAMQRLLITAGPIGLFGLALLATAAFVVLLRRSQNRRRGLQRRYPCRISAVVIDGDTFCQVIIRDISCAGLKIQAPPDFVLSDRFKVSLGDHIKPCDTRWRNAHYVGGHFDTPFRRRELLALLKSSGHNAPQEPDVPADAKRAAP